jgi:ArsR family transcriptional regulator
VETVSQEATASLFKVLMHPERLAILEMLRGGERCVCEIESSLGQRQAYVSQQLTVLRNAGLVESRRDGWRVFYRVVTPEIFAVILAAQAMLSRTTQVAVMNQSLIDSCVDPA